MATYNKELLDKWINEIINEQNPFWWGCIIGLQYGRLYTIRTDEDEEPAYCVNTEEERENTFKPIVRVKYGSPYKGSEPKGYLVKWYDEVNHEPVDVSYLRNKPEPVDYETGAKQHHINSLILFTDNTKELVELRDEIYERHVNDNVQTIPAEAFELLCHQARYVYFRDVADDGERDGEYFKIRKMQYKKYRADVMEFCQIYADRFKDWKLSHDYAA